MVRMSRMCTPSDSKFCSTFCSVDSGTSFGHHVLHQLGRFLGQVIQQRLRLLAPEQLGGVRLNDTGQVRRDYGARIHYGVAQRLRIFAAARFDPDGGKSKGGIARLLAGQLAQYPARVDRQEHSGKDFAVADLDPFERDAIRVGAQLEIVADVHRGDQKSHVGGEFLAQATDAAQQFAVLVAIHEGEQPVAHLQPQRIDGHHVGPRYLRRLDLGWLGWRCFDGTAPKAVLQPVRRPGNECRDEQEGQCGMPGIMPRKPI